MTVSSVNTLISLQESQLIHMLQQQTTRAKTEAGAEQRRAWLASGGQDLPGAVAQPGTNDPADDSAVKVGVASTPWEPADPALNPDNINALLLSLQTQQASLDTTLLLDGSSAGPGGRSLIDYLTDPENRSVDAANDDGTAFGAVGSLS